MSLLTVPPEIMLDVCPSPVILHILLANSFNPVLYLDLPDLVALANSSVFLRRLANDPVLHYIRLHRVAPSRLLHFLDARRNNLRPSIPDLVHRHVMRGLNLDFRWRRGIYLYSPQSVRLYEISNRLATTRIRNLLSTHLTLRKVNPLRALHHSRILPDVESSSAFISKSLLPVLHRLKWSIQRDRLANILRQSPRSLNPAIWLLTNARLLTTENERVRLVVCPGAKRLIRLFENH